MEFIVEIWTWMIIQWKQISVKLDAKLYLVVGVFLVCQCVMILSYTNKHFSALHYDCFVSAFEVGWTVTQSSSIYWCNIEPRKTSLKRGRPQALAGAPSFVPRGECFCEACWSSCTAALDDLLIQYDKPYTKMTVKINIKSCRALFKEGSVSLNLVFNFPQDGLLVKDVVAHLVLFITGL